jgi:hypothetical protein
MKEKLLICQGDPCTICLDDPAIQTVSDAQARGERHCRYYEDRNKCSPPRFGCVQLAGRKVAQYVLQFYSEATEETLAMEVEEFRRNGPLPPNQLEAYVDTPDHGSLNITNPEVVVQRVADYARKVLDLKPGERVFRSPEEHLDDSSDQLRERK